MQVRQKIESALKSAQQRRTQELAEIEGRLQLEPSHSASTAQSVRFLYHHAVCASMQLVVAPKLTMTQYTPFLTTCLFLDSWHVVALVLDGAHHRLLKCSQTRQDVTEDPGHALVDFGRISLLDLKKSLFDGRRCHLASGPPQRDCLFWPRKLSES